MGINYTKNLYIYLKIQNILNFSNLFIILKPFRQVINYIPHRYSLILDLKIIWIRNNCTLNLFFIKIKRSGKN